MRERYEDWLDRVWGVPAWGTSQQRQAVMRRAAIKRARKAAKRLRDAELTRLGQRESRDLVAMVTDATSSWRLRRRWSWTDWVVALHDMRRFNASYIRERRSRGGVVP